jgi:glucose-6-phosphate isomerase
MIAVQGFIWGINFIDPWGVESLARNVRQTVNKVRTKGESVLGYNCSTSYVLNRFLQVLDF